MGGINVSLIVLFAAAELSATDVATADAPRLFARGDYERYFSVGRFESWATYYGAKGILDVLGDQARTHAGQYILRQTTRTLDVARNYDVLSRRGFYKIESRSDQSMIWDEARHLYVYVFSDRDFDADPSLVFESTNEKAAVTKDDAPRGRLHQFYKEADVRAGQDPAALDAKYRSDVVGAWTLQCAYLTAHRFEVDCTLVHQPTQRIEHYLYRRLDQLG